jgi:hypothetical protein
MNRRRFLRSGSALALGSTLAGFRNPARAAAPALPAAGADGWVSMLNGRDLDGWYSVLGKSGKGAAEQKGMVTMEERMLHIMGNQAGPSVAEAGYLATNQEFENVHVRVEYKWGVKRFAPRSFSKRDNGLFGQNLTAHGWDLPPSAAPDTSSPSGPSEMTTFRKIKDGNFENLDSWNVLEVLWQGDRSAHIVNGRAVNVLSSLEQPDPQRAGAFIPSTRGRIAVQFEYAEIWFRRIEVRALG